jgi:hypothetical protein
MKALSLSQPWCWAVLHAGKHVENRSWQPPLDMIDQQIALHAAKSWDGSAVTFFIDLDLHGFPSERRDYPVSAIVGLATIDRIVTKPDTLPDDQRRWFFGEYGWVIRNVLSLPRPVPCRGFQGLWTVPDDALAQIREMAA